MSPVIEARRVQRTPTGMMLVFSVPIWQDC